MEDTNPWADVVRRTVERRRRANLARQSEDQQRISKLRSAAEDARRAWLGAVRGEKTTRRQTYVRRSTLLAEAMTSDIGEELRCFASLLVDGIDDVPDIGFEALKGGVMQPVFDAKGLDVAEPPPNLEALMPKRPSPLLRPFLRARYENQVEEAKREYAEAVFQHSQRGADRQEALGDRPAIQRARLRPIPPSPPLTRYVLSARKSSSLPEPTSCNAAWTSRAT